MQACLTSIFGKIGNTLRLPTIAASLCPCFETPTSTSADLVDHRSRAVGGTVGRGLVRSGVPLPEKLASVPVRRSVEVWLSLPVSERSTTAPPRPETSKTQSPGLSDR